MNTIQFSRLVVFANALVPLTLLLWDVYQKRVGANPLEFVTRTTGMLALIFLVCTLAITPIRNTTRLNWLVKFRRMLGLFAFFYGSLHLLTYIWFDRYFNLKSVPRDIVSRPFIALGMAAFLSMLPLAITSTNKMVKRLGGRRWQRLHQLVYLAGTAAVLHFWFLVKSDVRLPLTFGFILLLLLAHRIFIRIYPPENELPGAPLIPRE